MNAMLSPPRLALRYTAATCDLGTVLLAATDRGVRAVFLGDHRDELLATLHSDFPTATIREDAADLEAWMNELVEYLDGRTPDLDLPVDVRGTVFQKRVWDELCRIPRGEIRSYQQVADAIGSPTAVRAVARACATNAAAIVIPCHRVIGSDGKMHGYRWGVERKKMLLEMEASEERERG